MLENRNGRAWVEPFVGGANMIDKVDGKRIGADFNEYLIKALEFIRDRANELPDIITEFDYERMKQDKVVNGITGFTAFAMSFGGKFFGGYRRDVAGTKGCIENMKTQTRRSRQNAIKQSEKLQGVEFIHSSYQDLEIPANSLIYCDPPYEGTTKYKGGFSHSEFWEWCRVKSKEGHLVYISEYNAPKDFKCIYSKEVNSSLTKDTGSKKANEKLFVYSNNK